MHPSSPPYLPQQRVTDFTWMTEYHFSCPGTDRCVYWFAGTCTWQLLPQEPNLCLLQWQDIA
eukprot:15366379-Ditylum_brightwellii.AAC.1